MPHIIIRNCSMETVQFLSKQITPTLADIIGCPNDWIVFYCANYQSFVEGHNIDEDSVYVEVEWFERELYIQDEVVKIIHNAFLGLNRQETVIYFKKLDSKQYYENGVLCI